MKYGIGWIALAWATSAVAQDRLALSADGVTLTDTNGGGGGSLTWLHNFNPKFVLGAGGEYQKLADARWKFGSLTAAWTAGAEGKKWSLYGEAHGGNGDDNTHDFTYQTAVLGVILPLYRRLSLQIEDKQIDVDTTHGNLPKVGLSLFWTPRLETNASYAHSVGGNLGTDLTTLRMDYYPGAAHFILGGAAGPANTVVLTGGLLGGNFPARSVRQGFIGFGRRYARADFLLLGDYLEIGDSKRATLTLSCTIDLNKPAVPK